MALVAYEYSDSSDLEDDENVTIETPNTVEEPPQEIKESSLEISNDQNLFNQLPQPSKKNITVVEEDDEFLHKKEVLHNIPKPKAKITVPSLSDFKDVEGTIPSTKPKAVNGKKSGLLSILPLPRNAAVSSTTKSFVPHVLTQKQETHRKKNQEPVIKPKQETKSLTETYLDDSDDNDEEIQNDFFSMNKTNDIPLEDTSLDINKNQASDINVNTASGTKSRAEVLQSYFKQETVTNELQPALHDTGGFSESYIEGHSSSNYENMFNLESSSNNEVALDEEAIMKLCGTRGKRKREEIQIVDVNQQEVLADARDWLLKGLMDDTTKRVSASKRRGDEPTSQQRRKHQITYLAHQAKANEAELQNQWANNRMSKRQTQSKYGF